MQREKRKSLKTHDDERGSRGEEGHRVVLSRRNYVQEIVSLEVKQNSLGPGKKASETFPPFLFMFSMYSLCSVRFRRSSSVKLGPFISLKMVRSMGLYTDRVHCLCRISFRRKSDTRLYSKKSATSWQTRESCDYCLNKHEST